MKITKIMFQKLKIKRLSGGKNLTPSCAVVTKSGNLNFLEPSGPPQARNETALLFYLEEKST
jgi:hypothetical protein